MSLNSGINKTLNHFIVHAVATAVHQLAYCDLPCWYDAMHCRHNSHKHAGSPHAPSK
jgi:hypothetical protein